MGVEAERIINAIDREINNSRNGIVDLDNIKEFKEFKDKLSIYKGPSFGMMMRIRDIVR